MSGDKIQKLKDMLRSSKYVVFFGGAGVSTESNIPDFRSEDGIYKTLTKYGRSPEELLSHTFSCPIRRSSLITTGITLYLLSQAKPGLHGAGGTGEEEYFEIGGYPEYRRPAPDGWKP